MGRVVVTPPGFARHLDRCERATERERGLYRLRRKTPKPVFNSIKSLVTHTVYGCGLYLAALVVAAFLPKGR
jgi:hypothetical protein